MCMGAGCVSAATFESTDMDCGNMSAFVLVGVGEAVPGGSVCDPYGFKNAPKCEQCGDAYEVESAPNRRKDRQKKPGLPLCTAFFTPNPQAQDQKHQG